MVKYIMSDLTKLTKAQLISVIEEQEENKFDNFKEAVDFTKKYRNLALEDYLPELHRLIM